MNLLIYVCGCTYQITFILVAASVLTSIQDKYSEWQDCVTISFVFNCLKPLPSEVKERKKKYSNYDVYTDIMPIPVYIIRKCSGSSDPCRIIIDHDNRVYQSWSEYIECNKLHKCIMIVPKNGRYKKINNEVPLSEHYSPACAVGQDVLIGADITSAVVGLGTTGVYVAAAIPALTVAPIALTAAAVTGACVGIYSIIRSSMTIHDRRIHAESMSFANSEARGAYLNIVAGSLGFVGAGATAAVSQLAGRGFVIGKELEDQLDKAKKEINILTEQNNIYQKEKIASEKNWSDQLEEMRNKLREVNDENSEVRAALDYDIERFKVMHSNTDVYRKEIKEHKQMVMVLKEETLQFQTKLSNAEVKLANSDKEIALLRDRESRFLKELEFLKTELHALTDNNITLRQERDALSSQITALKSRTSGNSNEKEKRRNFNGKATRKRSF